MRHISQSHSHSESHIIMMMIGQSADRSTESAGHESVYSCGMSQSSRSIYWLTCRFSRSTALPCDMIWVDRSRFHMIYDVSDVYDWLILHDMEYIPCPYAIWKRDRYGRASIFSRSIALQYETWNIFSEYMIWVDRSRFHMNMEYIQWIIWNIFEYGIHSVNISYGRAIWNIHIHIHMDMEHIQWISSVDRSRFHMWKGVHISRSIALQQVMRVPLHIMWYPCMSCGHGTHDTHVSPCISCVHSMRKKEKWVPRMTCRPLCTHVWHVYTWEYHRICQGDRSTDMQGDRPSRSWKEGERGAIDTGHFDMEGRWVMWYESIYWVTESVWQS